MRNQRALAICQKRRDESLPDDYWMENEEAPSDKGAEEYNDKGEDN